MALLRTYLVIGLGSALGGLARYLCGILAGNLWGTTFPWGTLLVNVVGSLIIGGFATLSAPDGRLHARTLTRQFVMIGICGGYTTFSSFSIETLQLLKTHRPAAGYIYIGLSLLLCLGAVWLGHVAAARINK